MHSLRPRAGNNIIGDALAAPSFMINQYPDWLREAARRGGRVKSAAKTAAAKKANAARWRDHNKTTGPVALKTHTANAGLIVI